MIVQRDVMNVYSEALLPERSEYGRAVGLTLFESEADDVEMPRRGPIAPHHQGLNRQVAKGFIVSGCNVPTARDPLCEPVELRIAQGTLKVGDSIIEPEIEHLVFPRPELLSLPMVGADAVIAKKSCPR